MTGKEHMKLVEQLETELSLKILIHEREYQELRNKLIEKHGLKAVERVEQDIKTRHELKTAAQ